MKSFAERLHTALTNLTVDQIHGLLRVLDISEEPLLGTSDSAEPDLSSDLSSEPPTADLLPPEPYIIKLPDGRCILYPQKMEEPEFFNQASDYIINELIREQYPGMALPPGTGQEREEQPYRIRLSKDPIHVTNLDGLKS